MGLDIIAYKGLKRVENPVFDEDGFPKNEEEWMPGAGLTWAEEHWKGRSEPIEADVVYTRTERYKFRAGSYSGYNWWRDRLDEFKGDCAFQELINFSDCEGVIGSVVSRKLYEDFKKYHDEAIIYAKGFKDGDFFIDRYEKWLKAFEIAKDNGAVDFS